MTLGVAPGRRIADASHTVHPLIVFIHLLIFMVRDLFASLEKLLVRGIVSPAVLWL
jgi:hypothetical protein